MKNWFNKIKYWPLWAQILVGLLALFIAAIVIPILVAVVHYVLASYFYDNDPIRHAVKTAASALAFVYTTGYWVWLGWEIYRKGLNPRQGDAALSKASTIMWQFGLFLSAFGLATVLSGLGIGISYALQGHRTEFKNGVYDIIFVAFARAGTLTVVLSVIAYLILWFLFGGDDDEGGDREDDPVPTPPSNRITTPVVKG